MFLCSLQMASQQILPRLAHHHASGFPAVLQGHLTVVSVYIAVKKAPHSPHNLGKGKNLSSSKT